MSTWKELNALTGGLSAPSKMPSFSWNISAFLCIVGSLLRKVKGSACEGCYALKGRYVFPNVRAAMARRMAAWRADPEAWIGGMIGSILKAGRDVFRWFDSGDLQSVEMLSNIVRVCEGTPSVRHWLPTRERDIVAEYLKEGGKIPRNLVVRLSSPMVDTLLPVSKVGPLKGIPVSTIHTLKAPRGAYACPAPSQGNECADCRECWNPRRKVVSYSKH